MAYTYRGMGKKGRQLQSADLNSWLDFRALGVEI